MANVSHAGDNNFSLSVFIQAVITQARAFPLRVKPSDRKGRLSCLLLKMSLANETKVSGNLPAKFCVPTVAQQ
jgi:hypothetical protein